MTLSHLARRIAKLHAVISQEQDSDTLALQLIQADLVHTLSQIGEDGTMPDHFVELEHTPAEQVVLDRFAIKYDAAGAKAELLRQLERSNE